MGSTSNNAAAAVTQRQNYCAHNKLSCNKIKDLLTCNRFTSTQVWFLFQKFGCGYFLYGIRLINLVRLAASLVTFDWNLSPAIRFFFIHSTCVNRWKHIDWREKRAKTNASPKVHFKLSRKFVAELLNKKLDWNGPVDH